MLSSQPGSVSGCVSGSVFWRVSERISGGCLWVVWEDVCGLSAEVSGRMSVGCLQGCLGGVCRGVWWVSVGCLGFFSRVSTGCLWFVCDLSVGVCWMSVGCLQDVWGVSAGCLRGVSGMLVGVSAGLSSSTTLLLLDVLFGGTEWHKICYDLIKSKGGCLQACFNTWIEKSCYVFLLHQAWNVIHKS